MNDFNFDQANYTDLLAEAKRLNTQVSELENRVNIYQVALVNRDRQLNTVAPIIKELIESEVITDEDVIGTLVEQLNLAIMRSVSFTVTMEITGTMEIPYGQDVEEYSFEVESLTYDGNMVDVDYSSVESLNYDFTE